MVRKIHVIPALLVLVSLKVSAGGEPITYYPDCDGDTFFDGLRSCTTVADPNLTDDCELVCDSGTFPDGGWTDIKPFPGDCDDNDADVSDLEDWYPDCDGDNIHSSAATNACIRVDTAAASPAVASSLPRSATT